ncbi:DUF58 domain-containing protein [Jatrophihabitans sp. YIM 134969]
MALRFPRRGGVSGTADPSAAPAAPLFEQVLDVESAEPLLARLELVVRHRLDGLLQGNHLGLVPGPGSEAGESRPYVPGDDVRRMDWSVTARTSQAHVRETVADRELETWLVVDLSPSLDFGTGRSEKRELVLAAATALVHLTAGTGNRVGAVITTGEQVIRVPARGGRAHARHLLETIAATPRATTGRRGDLAAAVDSLRRPPRRRGLVAVISDFLDPVDPAVGPDWMRPLRGLGARHQLLAVEIVDPRELELAATGLVTFVDPESGQQLEVQTSDPEVRVRYAAAAAEQRRAITTAIRRGGAAHLQLRTDRDWVADTVRFVLAQRHAGAGTTPAPGVVRAEAVR